MRKMMLFVVVLVGCTKPEPSKRLLEKQGYTDVEITGYDWFACSDDDTYATGFKATSPTGEPVAGAVCAGLFFKGATVRFND